MDSNNFDAVVTILADKLGIPRHLLRPEARLVEDLGMDSVDRVQLTTAVEHEFRVRVPDEEIDRLRLVADVVTVIENLQGGARDRATTNVA